MPNPATKQIGPLPLWGWVVVGGASYWLYQHVYKAGDKSGKLQPQPMAAATATPPILHGGWVPDVFMSQPYPSPHIYPVAAANPSPTPGSQGGPVQPGGTPSTLPAIGKTIGGALLDPTTGRPIYSGPNGEGGYGWVPGTPVPTGQQTYQMSDGRWASYVPNVNIQNGNRVALGLPPVGYASSTAPGANPAVVANLLQLAGISQS